MLLLKDTDSINYTLESVPESVHNVANSYTSKKSVNKKAKTKKAKQDKVQEKNLTDAKIDIEFLTNDKPFVNEDKSLIKKHSIGISSIFTLAMYHFCIFQVKYSLIPLLIPYTSSIIFMSQFILYATFILLGGTMLQEIKNFLNFYFPKYEKFMINKGPEYYVCDYKNKTVTFHIQKYSMARDKEINQLVNQNVGDKLKRYDKFKTIINLFDKIFHRI